MMMLRYTPVLTTGLKLLATLTLYLTDDDILGDFFGRWVT